MWSGAEFGVKKEDLRWLEQEKVREGKRVLAGPKPNEPTKPTKPISTHQTNQAAQPAHPLLARNVASPHPYICA